MRTWNFRDTSTAALLFLDSQPNVLYPSNIIHLRRKAVIDTCVHVMEAGKYPTNEIDTQMALDVTSKSFWKLRDHGCLVHATSDGPLLALRLPDPQPDTQGKLSPSHPPFYVSHLKLHRFLPGRMRVQKDLSMQQRKHDKLVSRVDSKPDPLSNLLGSKISSLTLLNLRFIR